MRAITKRVRHGNYEVVIYVIVKVSYQELTKFHAKDSAVQNSTVRDTVRKFVS